MNEDDFILINPSDTLDLHHFKPSEVKELLGEFIYSCAKNGIYEGRIVHGKGTGTLREIVHAYLKDDLRIASYSLGDHQTGGWGATKFRLNKPH